MDFPDMRSLLFAAEVHGFRKPIEGETEDGYRAALADHVAPIDSIESCEIRNKVGWDKWPDEQNRDALRRQGFPISTTTRHAEQRCRKCGHRLDAATSTFGSRAAEVGDISICIECGLLSVFDENMRIREPTPEEKAVLNSDPRVIEAQILIAGGKPSVKKLKH